MNSLRIGLSLAALILLACCSTLGSDGKIIDYGSAASKARTLEMPPDLTSPAIDERYKIPGDAGNIATFSDFSKGSTSKVDISKEILPDIPDVHLERNGMDRWLVIKKRAEEVWPIVREFWLDNGLKIKTEDTAAGLMETDWAENLAKLPTAMPKNIGDEPVIFGNFPIGERDQYVTRLERSKDGTSTEVHITQRGMEEIFTGDKKTPTWQGRGSDPEKVAIILQRLMVRFGSSEARASDEFSASKINSSASSVAVTKTMAISPEAISAPELPGSAALREISNGSTIIVMNDTFDRAWRKVGLAIDNVGLKIEDKDREKGVFYLKPVKLEVGWLDKLKFWKSNVDTTSHYRVYVKDGGSTCEVSIADQNGVSNKVSKEMLEAIFKSIVKPS